MLAFGASLNQWTTMHGTAARRRAGGPVRRATRRRSARHHDARLGLAGDAARGARRAARGARAPRRRAARAAGTRSAEAYDAADDFDEQPGDGTIDPRRLVVELDRALPARADAIVYDGGHFHWFPTALPVRSPTPTASSPPRASSPSGSGSAPPIGVATAQPGTAGARAVRRRRRDDDARRARLDRRAAAAGARGDLQRRRLRRRGPPLRPASGCRPSSSSSATATSPPWRARSARAPRPCARRRSSRSPVREWLGRARRPARARLQGQPRGPRRAARRGVQGRRLMVVACARAPSGRRRIVAVLLLLVLWELVVRAGLIPESSIPPASASIGELVTELGQADAVEGGRQHAPGLGDRARHRDRARRARRHPHRLEPLGLPRAAGADRVPAPDPLGRADPARGARLRHRAGEQGLPRRVRVVLAAADPDDLRRPGRRPGGDRHRARVRARAPRADVAHHASRARCPTSPPASASPPRSR